MDTNRKPTSVVTRRHILTTPSCVLYVTPRTPFSSKRGGVGHISCWQGVRLRVDSFIIWGSLGSVVSLRMFPETPEPEFPSLLMGRMSCPDFSGMVSSESWSRECVNGLIAPFNGPKWLW
ncbi:hypothetical protein CDAR_593551 [Caerostris darwini]|uniref:Uncharacterized protein n=1 Tax=Caerostris darwini TaxID=1538125 RepID=A0AAV4RWB4_9ARAC|nr:hypothetical protein CDAR_593551 [Caerostris darwini]